MFTSKCLYVDRYSIQYKGIAQGQNSDHPKLRAINKPINIWSYVTLFIYEDIYSINLYVYPITFLLIVPVYSN